MKMWRHTSGVVIEPHEPKVMSGRPPKYRRKAKNEPRKKYGKLSKRGVKMTCSLCHQVGHNKKVCPTMAGMEQPGGYPSSSQPPVFSQPSSSSHPPLFRQPSSSSQPPLFSRPSSSSQPPVFNHQGSSMCFDSSAVRREQQPAKSRGTGRCIGRCTGRGTDRGIGRGTEGVSSQQPDQPRAMEDSISTRRQKMTKTVGFDIYTNASGSQTFNLDTSGERVITPGVYQDAAPTNIDIDYKPQGLKWNGGDVVTASQLQRISQSRKNKRGTSSAPRNA